MIKIKYETDGNLYITKAAYWRFLAEISVNSGPNGEFFHPD